MLARMSCHARGVMPRANGCKRVLVRSRVNRIGQSMRAFSAGVQLTPRDEHEELEGSADKLAKCSLELDPNEFDLNVLERRGEFFYDIESKDDVTYCAFHTAPKVEEEHGELVYL
uniref:Uncharacterized protein n=1 Tax=Mucochytrium quahogii TaxID=96639 RepID=A0A7S2RNF0_9STRA|mmetsp:Transcript_13275/g.21663  ORF Transcript_13275/g.21663 Transcript_13275/m.21663 type:complete len:115 (+) Transcript_13275:300-644(+)